jgi:Tol biopolymer transport system component
LQGDPVPIAEVVGTGSLGFAYFSVSNNGVLTYGTAVLGKRQMEWRDRKGTVLGPEGPAGVYFSPRVSPDSSAVVLARVEAPNADIWLYEFGRKVMTRLTVEPGIDNFPLWSPDGRRLLFSASRGGPRNLYVKQVGGNGSEERITESPHSQFPSDWSRDGRYLLYTELHAKTASDIWLLPLQGVKKKPRAEPFLTTPFDEMNARFSPDGKWIVYSSNESGAYEIYAQPFPASGKKGWYRTMAAASQFGGATESCYMSQPTDASWQ